MSYVPPNLWALLKDLKTVRESYVRSKHEQEANFLEILRQFIRQQIKDPTISSTELHEVIMGAAFFIRRAILDEYSTDDRKPHDPTIAPSHLPGHTTGSTLFTGLAKALNITEENPLDRKTELIYLQKFYDFYQREILSTKDSSDKTLIELLKNREVNIDFITAKVENTLSNRLKNLREFILMLSRAIPTQAEVLKKYECDEVQGFLYSYPLSSLDFKNLFQLN